MIIKEDVLPKDKFDEERAFNLFNFTKEELEPFIPDLLEWLQDLNWPISYTISKVLSKSYQDELIPYFEDIFKTNDDIWIYNCLRYIYNYLNIEDIKKLKPILEKFAFEPTAWQVEAEINIEAMELLEKIKKK